jgi:hypothetical protein
MHAAAVPLGNRLQFLAGGFLVGLLTRRAVLVDMGELSEHFETAASSGTGGEGGGGGGGGCRWNYGSMDLVMASIKQAVGGAHVWEQDGWSIAWGEGGGRGEARKNRALKTTAAVPMAWVELLACVDLGIYMYMYMYVYTHTHTYIHTYIHTYVHTYIHTHTHMYVYIYIHSYIHTYTRMYIHTYTHTPTHIHTYIHSFIHTYTHTHTHTHTHTNTHTGQWWTDPGILHLKSNQNLAPFLYSNPFHRHELYATFGQDAIGQVLRYMVRPTAAVEARLQRY